MDAQDVSISVEDETKPVLLEQANTGGDQQIDSLPKLQHVLEASQQLANQELVMQAPQPPEAPPQLLILDRLMRYPLVGNAMRRSQDVYGKLKSISPAMETTLGAAEDMTRRLAVPLATRLGPPLSALDHTLAASLDRLESTVPLVRDTPSDILRRTERALVTLKELSLKRTNDALATTSGARALDTLDAASDRAMGLLDRYLPPHESEVAERPAAVAVPGLGALEGARERPEDGVGRAVHAVGKVGRTVSDRLQGKARRALPTAICSLGLAGPLNRLNGRVQAMQRTKPQQPQEPKSKN